jgi:hypothetical protein
MYVSECPKFVDVMDVGFDPKHLLVGYASMAFVVDSVLQVVSVS